MFNNINKPNLTVIIPISRVDSFVPIAINSIKKQTYKDYLCYIITGNLESSEYQKLVSYISDDSRFTIYRLSLGGIAFALNYGLNLTKTKYLARMDADDISHEKRFEMQINFLEKNQSHSLVGCNVELIDENGYSVAQKFRFYENNYQIRKALKYRMPLCHPALMFRTEVLFENRGYMYGNTSEDHELYLRIARNKKSLMANLPSTLFYYRRHNSQLTNIKNSKSAYCNISGFLFTEFLRTYNPMYLIGIIANHNISRRIRMIIRDRMIKI